MEDRGERGEGRGKGQQQARSRPGRKEQSGERTWVTWLHPHTLSRTLQELRAHSGRAWSGEARACAIRTVQQLPPPPQGLYHTPFVTSRCYLPGVDSWHSEDSMYACSQRLLLEVGWGGVGCQWRWSIHSNTYITT